MNQEFSTRQTTESKSRRSSFRMEKSDIWDPARFGDRAHPVCDVYIIMYSCIYLYVSLCCRYV